MGMARYVVDAVALGGSGRPGGRGCARDLPRHVSGINRDFTQRKGGDSNPRTTLPPSTVFKTAAFNRSATLPGHSQCYAQVGAARFYTGLPAQGEVAEWLKALAC